MTDALETHGLIDADRIIDGSAPNPWHANFSPLPLFELVLNSTVETQ